MDEKSLSLVGYTLSNATTTNVPIHIFNNSIAKEEEIVLIEDGKRRLLGILRSLEAMDPTLKSYVATHYIWKKELLEENKNLLNSYISGNVFILGEIKDNYLEENKIPPKPGSYVYSIKSPSILSNIIRDKNYLSIGKHPFSEWTIPLDPKYLNYHIGVFGSTGCGKSRLVLNLILEIIKKTNYKVIVFDHTGVDYVTFLQNYGEIIPSNKIKIPPNIIASFLAKLSRLSWQYYGDYLELTTFVYNSLINKDNENFEGNLHKVISRVLENIRKYRQSKYSYYSQKTLVPQNEDENDIDRWDFEKFLKILEEVSIMSGAKTPTIIKMMLYFHNFLPKNIFEDLNKRVLSVKKILELLSEKKLVIIDMSYDNDIEIKRSIIASIFDEVWKRIIEGKEFNNIIFVIDEAQNYVSEGWSICKDLIEKTAREGRKWGLGLILISQRIVSDIDTSIRSNINTIFFSRLTSFSDIKELSNNLSTSGLDFNAFSKLRERYFYVSGLMNPLRVPILMKVNEVKV